MGTEEERAGGALLPCLGHRPPGEHRGAIPAHARRRTPQGPKGGKTTITLEDFSGERLKKAISRAEVYARIEEKYRDWRAKIYDIVQRDSFEEVAPNIYLYHPLPGRKKHHILRVEHRPPGEVWISCSCQGMESRQICTHAIALRIILGYDPGDVPIYYQYRAPPKGVVP